MSIFCTFAPENNEMPHSSSRPRTSGFHPEDQGFESPMRYKKAPQKGAFLFELFIDNLGIFAFHLTE